MAWEAILSTDPRFEMDFEIDDIDLDDDESQDPNGIFDRNHRLGLLRVLLHVQNVLPDHCIQFYNKEDRRRRHVMLDQPIKPLSTVDSTDPNNIIDLIKYVPEGEVVISHQAVFVKDEKGAENHCPNVIHGQEILKIPSDQLFRMYSFKTALGSATIVRICFAKRNMLFGI